MGGIEEGVLSARGVTKGTTVESGIESRVRTLRARHKEILVMEQESRGDGERMGGKREMRS